MATWTDIANSQVQPYAPVTSELMTALRDNPQALAEGASGAPRIAVSCEAANGSSQDFVMQEGATGFTYDGGFITISSGALFRIALSDDGGSTFGSNQTIFSTADGGGASGS